MLTTPSRRGSLPSATSGQRHSRVGNPDEPSRRRRGMNTTTRWQRWYLPMILIPLLAGGCGGTVASLTSTSTARVTASQGSASGWLAGQLIMEGGALGANGPRPIPGSVYVSTAGRPVVTVGVDSTGEFRARLPHGSYQVRACTSKIQTIDPSGVHTDDCGQTVVAVVRAGATTQAHLADFIVP